MQQWEYMGVRLMPDSEKGRIIVMDPAGWKGTPLNALGRQGWEVVGVFRDNFWVLLKRPLAAPAAEQGAPGARVEAPPAPAAPPSDNLQPVFGTPDEARVEALERKLQQELGRRNEGGGRPGRR